MFVQKEYEAILVQNEQLKQHKAEEMREVENYVEHIRSLSVEREALTVELEAENETLKQQIESLQVQTSGIINYQICTHCCTFPRLRTKN